MKKVKIEENSPEEFDAQANDAASAAAQSPAQPDMRSDTTNTTAQDAASPESAAGETSAASTEAAAAQPPAQPPAQSPVQPDVQVAELLSDLQRTRADFENYRKQVESQKTLAMSAAKYATVEKFLPLVDDFERALSAYPEQLAPLRKSFDKTLANLGLAPIDSAPGTEFNPDLHEAVSVEDNAGDAGNTEVVAETLRPGYLYDGSVIRAAMVKVKHK